MTKEEMITKWEEQVAMWRRVIDEPLMYTKEDRYKATFYSAAICSMIEDLKKLTLPQVSNNEAVVSKKDNKPITYTTCDDRNEQGKNIREVAVCRYCGSYDITFNGDAGVYICDNCNMKAN